ncbi:MAG: hypothetical protein P8M72_06820 [Gammaproteobacteria bacterium]|nr:hypothetical protein [Gammaproteobacteria bacterium]
MGLPNIFTFILLSVFLTSPVIAQQPQDESIGSVVLTKGTVQASNGANVRDLRRRSEIFAGDRITAGPSGFAQIRMIDGAINRLSEETVFTFHTYEFDGEDGKPDKAVMELHEGGMRTLDGFIRSNADDEYRLITPDTEVTPQGATYECVVENEKTYCGVFDSSISMKNEIDSVQLGLGGNWDYAEVESRQTPHVPLLTAPDILGQITINPGNNQTVTTPQPTPTSVTPVNNGVSFPTPQTIRVIPYKK